MPDEKNEDKLITNAMSPKKVDIDGQVVEQHSVEDQIAALNYAASVKAAKSRKLGIRIGKMVHGGAE